LSLPYVAAVDHYAGTSVQSGTSFWFLPWGTAHHEGMGLLHKPLLLVAAAVTPAGSVASGSACVLSLSCHQPTPAETRKQHSVEDQANDLLSGCASCDMLSMRQNLISSKAGLHRDPAQCCVTFDALCINQKDGCFAAQSAKRLLLHDIDNRGLDIDLLAFVKYAW